MMKLFISQPMNGMSEDEIMYVRQHAVVSAERLLGEKVEVIDSFIKDAPEDANAVWYLGESIKLLSKASVVYFAHGWENARGCRMEKAIATEYQIPMIVE